jgi:hypothetical protein
MLDLIFVVTTVLFFAIGLAYATGCARMKAGETNA